ncbi:unnamed protein product, partial [Strongylus vulgaris]
DLGLPGFLGSLEDIRALSKSELLNLFGNTIKLFKNDIKTMGDLADRSRDDKVKGSVLMTKGAFKVNGEKMIHNNEPVHFHRICLPGAPDCTLICWGKRNFQLVEWV